MKKLLYAAGFAAFTAITIHGSASSSSGVSIQYLIDHNMVRPIGEARGPISTEDGKDIVIGLVQSTLRLDNQNIASLEGLQNIPGIKAAHKLSISLQNNKITEIKPGTFNGLHLTALSLQNNKLAGLDPSVFKGLDLRTLDLNDNPLSNVDLETKRPLYQAIRAILPNLEYIGL